MNAKIRFRSRIVLLSIILIAFLLGFTLFKIQIVEGENYAKKADNQYLKPRSALLDRGSIFFTSKDGTRIQAATLKNGYVVFMNPSVINDPSTVYDALSQYINLDKEDFLKKASRTGEKYRELANQVSEETAFSIRSLGLIGVGVAKMVWRVYPGDTLASHTLGILAQNASSSVLTGKYGLERSYEEILRRPDASSNLNAFAQLFSGLRNTIFDYGSEGLGDIVTSIEPNTQKYLEKIIGEINNTWKPEVVGGVIIDPNTGEIIAMSSLPNFNPNDTSGIRDIRVFSNPMVENAYEMGSIIKPLSMASAFDLGVANPKSTYNDTGFMMLNGKRIANHDQKAYGITSMQDMMGKSLNIGVANLALNMGKDEFVKYFLNLGLGSKTGIDLPSEASGLIGNLRTGREIEIATASYGQGIAVSPISVVRALSSLANGGYLITPHLVKEIRYTDGSIKKIEVEKKGPFLKKETTDDVTQILVEVVDKSLLKGAIKNERYSIAAKTGTAQIADPVKGGYYSDRYLHSFFGYFPAYNPKFLVFLFQVNPKGTDYASNTLTLPFDQITKFLLNYYNVIPDR